MSERHYGFTGTQGPNTTDQRQAMCTEFMKLIEQGFVWQHNGDCMGSDWVAGSTWINLGKKIHGHPPIIPTKRAYLPFDIMESLKDYRTRNQDIVDASELLVATPRTALEELRSGTWMTIRMARRKGIPRIIVYPDGFVHREEWHVWGEGWLR